MFPRIVSCVSLLVLCVPAQANDCIPTPAPYYRHALRTCDRTKKQYSLVRGLMGS